MFRYEDENISAHLKQGVASTFTFGKGCGEVLGGFDCPGCCDT